MTAPFRPEAGPLAVPDGGGADRDITIGVLADAGLGLANPLAGILPGSQQYFAIRKGDVVIIMPDTGLPGLGLVTSVGALGAMRPLDYIKLSDTEVHQELERANLISRISTQAQLLLDIVNAMSDITVTEVEVPHG